MEVTRPCSLAVAILSVALPFALQTAAAQKKAEASAVVAGTVFRDPGLALAEAKVVLMAAEKPKKLQESMTNYRGEFVFRVPAREAKYVVKASMKGFRPGEKEAEIHGEERVDVNLVLVPEAK